MDDDKKEDAEGEILSTYDSNGVRVIVAHGVMAKGFGSYPGAVVDTAELREALLEAEEDPEVDAVVIDWDSPGGYVDGVADAADVVTNMGKPVVSLGSWEVSEDVILARDPAEAVQTALRAIGSGR